VCVCVSVCLSVCLVCVRKVCCGKTADWIRMPFGVVSRVGLGMGIRWGGDCRRERGSFEREFGASHCTTNGAFATRSSQITLRTC